MVPKRTFQSSLHRRRSVGKSYAWGGTNQLEDKDVSIN